MKRRARPKPPPDRDLPDQEAAELERSVSLPGWRMDGPEFPQHAAVQLLAARWRRTPPEVQQERLADARRGIFWIGGVKKFAREHPLDQQAPAL
jgi:hypothetical protein